MYTLLNISLDIIFSQWPGYLAWEYPSIAIRHFGTSANGYTMEELAGTVSNHIRKFYQVSLTVLAK